MAHIRKRALSDGTTAFRVIWEDPSGKQQSKQFSRATSSKPADAAKTFKIRLENELLRGTYVDPRAGDLSFREFAEQWRDEQPHRPTTADRVERHLRVHILPTLGSMKLASIRRRDVQALATALAGGTLAPSSIAIVFNTVKAVFNAAVREHLIAESPCRQINLPEAVPSELIIPTPEQVDAIVAQCPPRYRALVLLAAGTGLRSGELCGLDVARAQVLARRVVVNRQLLTVRAGQPVFGPPKSAAGNRRVPLSPSYAATLTDHLTEFPVRAHGLIFSNRAGNPLTRGDIGYFLEPVLREAGFPPQTGLHLLRHFFASGLIAGSEGSPGLDVLSVMRLLGHASADETLRTYGHLWHDHEERTRLAIDAAFPAPPRRPSEGRLRAPRPSEGRAAESTIRPNKLGQVVQMPQSSSG